MRVVVIAGWAPSLLRFRATLLRQMVARGHEVIALAGDATPDITKGLADLGVRLQSVAVQRAGMDPRADARLALQLAHRLRQLAPHVVFAYTIKPVIYGTLAAALAGVPRRVAMVTGLGYALQHATSLRQRVVGGIAQQLYRLALSRAHAVVFQNNADRDRLADIGALNHAAVYVVRGSGVELDHFVPEPLPDGAPTFLFVGRLLTDKGIREFVDAAAIVRRRHRDARFRVLGWLDANPRSVSRSELDRWVTSGTIEYLGVTDDVRPHIAASHALILPSYHEGTPRSVLEAMAMQRAVIATDIPGCRDAVAHGESGLLVQPQDPAGLAAAILQLCDNPALVGRLGRAGRARAEALYDARVVAAQMLEIMGL